MRLFLAGDVMLGRGVVQVLPHSVDPGLHEPYVKDARRYVELAEEAGGPIPAAVSREYVRGDATCGGWRGEWIGSVGGSAPASSWIRMGGWS